MNAKVTRKGQVTIPKPVRDLLDIRPGMEVSFRRSADGSVIFDRADHAAPKSRLAALKGHAGKGPSTDEILTLTRGEE